MDFVYLFLAWGLYFVIHSVLASDSVKRKVKNTLTNLFPLYRIGYNLFAIISLLPVLYYQNSINDPIFFPINMLVQIIAYGILLSGLLLGYFAFKNYSSAEFLGLDYKQQSQANKLNTAGLNKHVRHPLYSASLLIVWGYFFSNLNSTSLIMATAITTYLIIGTKLEEKKLIVEFGQPYKEYIKNTPMLIPRFF